MKTSTINKSTLPFVNVSALCRAATLDVFIDEKALVDCAHQLHQAVQQNLKCQIATDKSAVVASTKTLAVRIRSRLDV